MKYNMFEKNKPRHLMNLDNLDKALHNLGMLSTITESRHDYLRETKSNVGLMRVNTRYVSNVTLGYCMKRTTIKNRICPYVLPMRPRTKSENSDAINSDASESNCDSKTIMNEPSTSGCSKELLCLTKRCQSLENLNMAVDNMQPGSETSPDLDGVSTRIQKLQVEE